MAQYATPDNRLKLPDNVPCERRKVRTSHGKMYVHVGYLNGGEPVEIFVTYGNMGSEARGFVDGIAKLASEMLRSGVHPARVVKNLRGIKTEPFGLGPNKVLSAADGIGKALEDYMAERFGPDWGAQHGWVGASKPQEPTGGAAPERPFQRNLSEVKPCPDCGTDLVSEGGCATCRVCAFSKCG